MFLPPLMDREYLGPMPTVYLSTVIFATSLWLAAIFTLRFILKRLLSYKGFMYEARGKVSLTTKIWSVSTPLDSVTPWYPSCCAQCSWPLCGDFSIMDKPWIPKPPILQH